MKQADFFVSGSTLSNTALEYVNIIIETVASGRGG